MLIIPAFLEENSDDIIKKINPIKEDIEWVQIDVTDDTMTNGSTCDLYDLVGELGDVNVEVHLMTTNPEKYFDACAAVGAQRVYFHIGEVESPTAVLSAMDPYDFTKGIVLSPQTSVDDAFVYIDEIDAVQVMTVVPGKQGGEFLPEMLNKVSHVRERRGDLWIAVDGGINADTIPEVRVMGVDAAGVGSALSNSDDMSKAFLELTEIANA